MEKLIGWLVIGIFYAIFSFVGKQNKQKEQQKKKDVADGNTSGESSNVPDKKRKPVTEIFGDLMKQFEQKANPVQKKKPVIAQQNKQEEKVTRYFSLCVYPCYNVLGHTKESAM